MGLNYSIKHTCVCVCVCVCVCALEELELQHFLFDNESSYKFSHWKLKVLNTWKLYNVFKEKSKYKTINKIKSKINIDNSCL